MNNKHKESTAADKGVEPFEFEQIISASLDMHHLGRGMYRLNNYDEVEKLRVDFKKNKAKKDKGKKRQRRKNC